MAALMLGIDFSKTDMQISLWDEERTRAEMYQFAENGGSEVLPVMVIAGEDGEPLTAKEALDYSMRTKKQGITSLYGNFSAEPLEFGAGQKTPEELFALYLQSVFSSIRKRYGGAAIAKIGITGERMTTEHIGQLQRVLERLGYEREKIFFSTHADAFLWYELCESNGAKHSSMTMDFDSKGMLSYVLTPAEENIPCYVATTDYSELMPGGLPGMLDITERKNCFENVSEVALARKQPDILYITGAFIEEPEIAGVLQKLSEGQHRIFAGRGLYCLGACWHAVKEKLPRNTIADRQIFYHVYLDAYKDAQEGPVRLLKAGTALEEAKTQVQVILDDTMELKFRIEDVRGKEPAVVTFRPEHFLQRENRTIRFLIELQFLDYGTLVVKVRDIGFGEIYPATYRVWEQIVHLG